MKKLLMECLGTFFLVLTIALTGNPIAIASMLMAWIYIGGLISGAHYNPMVSLAVAIRGGLSWHDFYRYAAAQIAGGFFAYVVAGFFHHALVLPAPGASVTLLQAFVMEVLLAFVLAFIVLCVATAEEFKGNYVFGFAIGFAIPALAAVGGPISGGLFNPALALGATLYGLFTGLTISWDSVAMYVAGACLGGALAAYAFNYFYVEYRRIYMKIEKDLL